jgi:hypothetical protein
MRGRGGSGNGNASAASVQFRNEVLDALQTKTKITWVIESTDIECTPPSNLQNPNTYCLPARVGLGRRWQDALQLGGFVRIH